MKKYQLGGLIVGILFSSIIYAIDEPTKSLELGADDIKIEIQRIDNEDSVAIGYIMVRINGKWFPFSNQMNAYPNQWRTPVITPANNFDY